MKKILMFTTALSLMVATLPSCLKDDKANFSGSPATRLDEAVKVNKQILESAPNGWSLGYYAGRNYSGPGFTLTLKFKDGKAYIMGDNKDATTVGVSEYDVVKDQGVVLTFPTYNSVIHELAGASQGYPEGLQGDYEFSILEANSNFIRLRGKKWKNEMILTPIKNQTQEEFIQKVFTIREGMTTNNYHFILGKDTLSTGEVNVDTRRLTAKINNVSYDLAYNLTDTGLNLSSPIKIGTKEYSSFTWNEADKSFNSGDLSIRLYIPKSHKTIDFWANKIWILQMDTPPGLRKRLVTTLHLSATRPGANMLEGELTFMDRKYKLEAIPYDPSTGTISLVGQPITDARFSNGIAFLPVGEGPNGPIPLEAHATDHRLTFTWNEEENRAVATGTQLSDGTVYGFVGAGYDQNNKAITDAKGNPIFHIYMINIQGMKIKQ